MNKNELRNIIKESIDELTQEGFLDSLGTIVSPKGAFEKIARTQTRSKKAQKIYNDFRDRIIKSYVIAYKTNEKILKKIHERSSSARMREKDVRNFINRFNLTTGRRYENEDIHTMNKSSQNEYVDSLLKFINLKPSYSSI